MSALIVLLLDNHHAPDRRAEWVSSVLRAAGAKVRIVAWDRRVAPAGPGSPPPPGEELVRIAAPAAWGAGRGTLTAMLAFWTRVLARRRELLAGAHAVIASDLYLLPLGRALTAGRGLPLIYEAREDWAALEAARRSPRVRIAVTRAESALARKSAAVIVPGEPRAPRWRSVGIEPVVLRNVGEPTPRPRSGVRWDVAYVGLMAEQRRPDLVLELARHRPDLRFVMSGAGRLEPQVREQATALGNVDYLGFVDDIDGVLAQAGAIVYGEDPSTPYSPLACPNTLYQAVGLRRPLVFFCAGEPQEAARRYRIGVRCRAELDDLSAAVDEALAGTGWEFDAAWSWLRGGAEDAFQARVRELVPSLG